MSTEAHNLHSQGLKLLEEGRLEVAVNFFTKAIDEDPAFLEAYTNRGETLIKLGKTEEGEKDLKFVEKRAKKSKTAAPKPKKKEPRKVQKYNLDEADDLWGNVLSDEAPYDSGDDLFLDDLLQDHDQAEQTEQYQDEFGAYDDQYDLENLLDDESYPEEQYEEEEDYTETPGEQYDEEEYVDQTAILEGFDDQPPVEEEYPEKSYAEEEYSEEAYAEEEQTEEEHIEEEPEPVPEEPEPPVSVESEVSSVLIEHIGGMQQEFSSAKLFEPEHNTLLLIDEDSGDEQIVFFEQLTCIRVVDLPGRLGKKKREVGLKETIETVDGRTYNELIHPVQDVPGILIGFNPDDQASYPVTLFPKSNVRKRTQDRDPIDIMLEKRFISKVMLKRALQEYQQIKNMTLEKILAKKARIPLAEIEEAVKQAQQGPMQGMQKEEILLFSGLVTEADILAAVERLESLENLEIEEFLIERRIVGEREVYISFSEKYRIPFVDLTGRKFSKASLARLPKNIVEKNEILPLALKDNILLVAAHVTDTARLREKIIKAAGCKDVKFVLSPPSQIRKITKMVYGK